MKLMDFLKKSLKSPSLAHMIDGLFKLFLQKIPSISCVIDGLFKLFLDATASLDYRMSVSDTFGSKHYTLENWGTIENLDTV